MSDEPTKLDIQVQQHGVRVYFVEGMRREKPYYSLRIIDAAGQVIFHDPWCADNEPFCRLKGAKLVAYYQQHGEWPEGEPVPKPFTFKEK